MEVKINVEKLVRSPLSFLVKVRELNIIGKLDFPGEMPPSPAGIAVNSKGVIAVTQERLRENLVVVDTWMDSLTNQSTSHSSTMTRFWWQMNVITEYSSGM